MDILNKIHFGLATRCVRNGCVCVDSFSLDKHIRRKYEESMLQLKACVWLLLPLLLLFLLRYQISLQNYEFECIRSSQIHVLAPHKNRFFISLWTLELFEASLPNRTYSCNYFVLTEHVFRTLLPQKTLSGLGKDQGTLYLIIWNGPWILESHFNVNEHWHKCVNGPLSGIPKWKRDSKQPVHFDNVQPKNVFHFGVIINIWNASQQHVLIISLNMRLFLRIQIR